MAVHGAIGMGARTKSAWHKSAVMMGNMGRKGSSMNDAERLASGKRRRNIAAGAPVGLYAVNRMRAPRSSGRDGIEPHSTGGYTV